jgi:hypothetical protein
MTSQSPRVEWQSVAKGLRRTRNGVVGTLRSRRAADEHERLAGPLELAALLVVGSAVGVVLFTSAAAPPPLKDALAVLALLGLCAGGTLLVQASRHYLLGLGGAVTCGFVAILLATYSGLAINASSSVEEVGGLAPHPDRPAVFLAMLGFLAALLLLPSPWSRHRKWVQPSLVCAGVVLPTIALLALPRGVPVSSTNVTARFVGHSDPLLILGALGLALVAPVQIAGSVGWVYFWVHGASRLKRSVASPKLHVVGLSVWAGWLLLGVAGALPRDLGGALAIWSTPRSAGAGAWLVAGVVTLAAGLFSARTEVLLERAEGAAAAGVGLVYILGQVGVALALVLLLLCALLTFQAEPVAAVSAVLLLLAALAVGSPVVWFVGAKRGQRLRVAAGCLVAVVVVACAALAWPTATNSLGPEGLYGHGHGIGTIAILANSNGIILAMLCVCPLTAVAWAACYMGGMRWGFDYRGRWKGTAEYSYALVMVPTVVWMLLGAVLLAPAAFAHPFANAFSRWPLPDPSEIAVVACGLTAAVGLLRWSRRDPVPLNERHLTGAVALSAMAFIPFLVPGAFRSGGRLALAGVVVVLVAALASVVARQLPDEARRRTVSWQLGVTALSVPLLAYAGLSAGHVPTLVGGALADIGHNTGPSPFSHMRLLVVVPLTVALVMTDRKPPRLRWKTRPRSRWKDFEADVLVLAVRDGDLPELLTVPLTRHLAGLDADERRSVALFTARALSRRYRVRGSASTSPTTAQASRAELDAAVAIAGHTAHAEVNGDELAAARATAARIGASAPFFGGAAGEVREHLAAALRIALADRDDPPADRDGLIDELASAVLAEVRATGRSYVALEKPSDAERERSMETYRYEVARIVDALQGRFTLFQYPYGLALAPALVLDDPERRRWGMMQPYKRPYAYVALIIAAIAGLAITAYFCVAIELRLVPHFFHVHN